MQIDDASTTRPLTRYRCTACGNLTRFDVVTTSTVSSFFHYSVGGDLREEDRTIVAEAVDSVACRWCGPRGDVVQIPNDAAAPPPSEDGDAPPGL